MNKKKVFYKTLNTLINPIKILRQRLIFDRINAIGGKITDSKIIVFESDDWGSIRVPSKKTYEALNQEGALLNMDPFTSDDGLESEKDILNLFTVLERYTDYKGNHPQITAFYAVKNADFQAMRSSGMKEFKSELFLDTAVRYDGKHSLDITKEGIKKSVFCPQLHCLQHLNVVKWMKDLNNGKSDTLKAFEYGMYGLGTNFDSNNRFGYMDSFHNRSKEELYQYRNVIKEAVDTFHAIFGYKPTVFVASCYVWDPVLEDYLAEAGISFISGDRCQLIPKEDNYEEFIKRINIMGSKNKNMQIYLTRNADFDLIYEYDDTFNICLRQIASAFSMGKPAIINIHRANFTSRINDKCKTRLARFDLLLKTILAKWPDVEFYNSDQLGNLIKCGQK